MVSSWFLKGREESTSNIHFSVQTAGLFLERENLADQYAFKMVKHAIQKLCAQTD